MQTFQWEYHHHRINISHDFSTVITILLLETFYNGRFFKKKNILER